MSVSCVFASAIRTWGSAITQKTKGRRIESLWDQCRSVFKMPVWNYARIIKKYKMGRDGQGTYKVYGDRTYIDGGWTPVVKKLDFDD